MNVYLFCDPEAKTVLVRILGTPPKEGVRVAVSPGERFRGYSYDQLMRLGSGRHDLPELEGDERP